MKIGDFLSTLSGKYGSKMTDFSLQGDFDLPDELSNEIIANLMSLEGAKHNGTLKAYFKQQALNAVDNELKAAIEELGLGSEVFSSDKDTYSRVRTLKSAFKELLDKKPEKASELEKTNRELHQKLQEWQKTSSEKEEATKKYVAEVETKANAQVLNHIKTASLKGLKWANDQPENVQIALANMLMAEELKKVGAVEVNKDGKIKLVMAYDPELEYSEKNVVVDYDTFKNRVLADNKLLAVVDTTKPPANPTFEVRGIQHQDPNPALANFHSQFDAATSGLKFNN
jgi:hypothetical protein